MFLLYMCIVLYIILYSRWWWWWWMRLITHMHLNHYMFRNNGNTYFINFVYSEVHSICQIFNTYNIIINNFLSCCNNDGLPVNHIFWWVLPDVWTMVNIYYVIWCFCFKEKFNECTHSAEPLPGVWLEQEWLLTRKWL